VRLAELVAKYPFLQDNLPFWEKYLQSRDELHNLLGEMVNEAHLDAAGFFQNLNEGKPLLAYGTVRLKAADVNRLSEVFCRMMGIPHQSVVLPTPLPLFEDLPLTADMAGFVAAELHAAIAAFAESVISAEKEINWLEPYCPICGATAGMALITPSGKKNLVCSHCQSGWVYLRTACGLCGQSAERGSTVLFADEEPDWLIEVCEECGHYLKVADMRDRLPDIISYPLHYLTTWELDLTVRGQGFEPSLFAIFSRAGWLQRAVAN